MKQDYSAAFFMNIHDNTCFEPPNDVTINNHISEKNLNIVRSFSKSITTSESIPEVEKNVDELISVVLNDKFEQQIDRAKSLDLYDNDAFSPLNTMDEDQGTKLPLLSSLHLPLTPYFISTVLNEIIKLSEIHPNANLLTLKRFDGSTTTLVPIPEAKNITSLSRNIRQKKWLQKIPECIFPSDQNVAVEWLFHELGKKYEDELVTIVKKLGYPLLAHEMTVTAAVAMWQ